MTYKINAENKILGRLATEVAMLLRGKNSPSFFPHLLGINKVEVTNIDKISVTGNKINMKFYWRYSGFPGGIKRKTYAELMAKDAPQILRKAVYGMLPKNKLREKLLKNLVIK